MVKFQNWYASILSTVLLYVHIAFIFAALLFLYVQTLKH